MWVSQFPSVFFLHLIETFPEPISWLGTEKLNLTQQKHAFTNQNKRTTTQNKHTKN